MRRAGWIAGGVVSLGLLLVFGLGTVCAGDRSERAGRDGERSQPDQSGGKAVFSNRGDSEKSVPSHSVTIDRAPSAAGRVAERSRANTPVDRAEITRGTASSRTSANVDRKDAVTRTRDTSRDASVSRSDGGTKTTAARTGRITVYERAKTLPARTEARATFKRGSNDRATDTARTTMQRAPKTLTKGDRATAVASADRRSRSTVTARAGASGHFEGDRARGQGARERGRDHSGATATTGGHTTVNNHTTVAWHDDHFRHERYWHRPPVFWPIVCRGWWWDGWCAGASGFGIGWHSKHWSVWLGDWRPAYQPVVVEGVYVAPAVIWYEPMYVSAPRVRIVEPYGRIERLADKLAYGTADEREDAARALGYEDTIRALEPLVDALQYDTDSMVRYEAARALGKLGFRDALPALQRAASEDPDEVVRDEAHDSIDAIINY